MTSEPLLLGIRSEVSQRTVVIADEGDSVWAYLTRPDSLRPERDCWLFNKPSAAASPDLDRYREASLPPPAPASAIDPAGVLDSPASARWSVRWSDDGDAAAIVCDGVDVGLLAAGEPRGMARHLRERGPWGLPWDAQRVAGFGL
jgi:hypothetical protein